MSFNNKNMLHTCHPIICPIYSFTEICRSYDTFITFQHKKKRAENCLILVRKVICTVRIIKCQPIQIKQMYCALCPVLISSSIVAHIVHDMNYTHSRHFAVVSCICNWLKLQIFFRFTSQAVWQSYYCPSVGETTLANTVKWYLLN